MKQELKRIECPVCAKCLGNAAGDCVVQLWCKRCKAARVITLKSEKGAVKLPFYPSLPRRSKALGWKVDRTAHLVAQACEIEK